MAEVPLPEPASREPAIGEVLAVLPGKPTATLRVLIVPHFAGPHVADL